MQITAAPTSVTPTTLPPADRVFKAHRHDFGSLFGLSFYGWGIDKPTELHVAINNPDLLKLDDNILRDVVDGITINFQLVGQGATSDLTRTGYPDGGAGLTHARRAPMHITEPRDGTPWYDSSSNMARAVATLPGVIAYGHEAPGESEPWTFWCSSQKDIDRLKAIVNDDLGGYSTRYVVGAPPMGAHFA